SHEIMTVNDSGVERQPAPRAEPVTQEVIDFRNDGGWQNQSARFLLHECPRARVPRVVTVVVRVDDAGVEEDAHVRRRLARARGAPNPVWASRVSTRSAVSV